MEKSDQQPILSFLLLHRRFRRRHAILSSLTAAPNPPPAGSAASHCFSPSSILSVAAALSFLGAALFIFWPSDPHLHVARISIDRVHVSFHPSVSVSIDVHLWISIHSPNFLSLDYDALDVAIGYREQRLGSVLSAGGHVRAREVSYVDAELQLDGIEVLHDIFYLIEDLARRSIPFDTVTEVRGGSALSLL